MRHYEKGSIEFHSSYVYVCCETSTQSHHKQDTKTTEDEKVVRVNSSELSEKACLLQHLTKRVELNRPR